MDYANWDMNSQWDYMYPIGYHERYRHMYPSIEPDICDDMVSPIMYPDIYYRIYPYASMICDRMDNPYMMYPSEAHVESMVDECYDVCVRNMPDLHDYAEMKAVESEAEVSQQFRRRPILRDLIAIILISELFRRRRRRFPFGRVFDSGSGYWY